ncbi:ATP-binding cassette domain-containing protein [Candidatus Sumerlaeota bacterium]|nr:ATP-binding cassette domain-containing protein [Candidatus Sumerlaeota bacterium]
MIETINLSKQFGTIKAVDDLSFKVKRGEVLGFLGPNGAGKSTTMKMLTCFLAPTSGTATVDGHDIVQDPMSVKKVVGYLPETAPAYGEMSVVAFLGFIANIRGFKGSAATEAVDKVIANCALESVRHQTIETLSKGYKRRVGLAQAIIHDPPVLIMDEPTDGLDPNQKHEVRELIKRMAHDKVIVLSTHILEEVEAVCTRAVIIAHGRLVADGTPDQLKQRSRWNGAVTISIKTNDGEAIHSALKVVPYVEKVEALDGVDSAIKRFRVYPMRAKLIAAGITELAKDKKWELDELHVEQGHLDEVFRELTVKPEGEAKA